MRHALHDDAVDSPGAEQHLPERRLHLPGGAAQDFTNALTSLYFKTRVTAGRSYAVIAWAPFQSVGEGGASLTVDIYDSNTCTTAPQGVNLDDNEPFVFGIEGHTSDHDNIIPATNGIVYIKVSNAVAAGYSVHVLVIETTLFSPWWFVGGTTRRSSRFGTTCR